jgi:hypothetical protein
MSRLSTVMNWTYEESSKTLNSWQSSAYANPGSGHTHNETKGSCGVGVNKSTGARNTQGQFVCSQYTNAVPKAITASAKNPVFFFDAISPSGREVTIRAEFSHRAKNGRYKVHTLNELMKLFGSVPVTEE